MNFISTLSIVAELCRSKCTDVLSLLDIWYKEKTEEVSYVAA